MAVQAAAALFRQTTEPSITCSPPPPIAGLRHVRKLQSDREKTTKRWTLTQYSVDHCRFRAATPNSFDAKHIELAFDAADVGICHHEIAEPRIYRAHPDPRRATNGLDCSDRLSRLALRRTSTATCRPSFDLIPGSVLNQVPLRPTRWGVRMCICTPSTRST